jgi:threonine/homoserine/homoserine lactone efflux protein
MLSADGLIAFVAAAVVMVAIPGPNVLFTIGRSIAFGRWGGFLSILGTAIGSVLLVVGVAFGVGTLIAQSIVLFTIIKVLGALYLAYLGVQAIRHRRQVAEALTRPERRSTSVRRLGEGFVVGVTNPKSIAFFVAVLPQFVDLQAGAVPLQLFLLGVIVVGIGVVCDTVWVLVASAARTWFARSPGRIEAMSATGGGLMIGLAAFLLVWRDKPAVA